MIIGGVAAAITADSATSLTFTLGNGASGAIMVTTPGGTTTSATNFTYFLPSATLTGITLIASPAAPQLTGTAITLTAAAQGSGITTTNVQYQFFCQYKLANGSWSADTIISDWSTSSSCVWTPTTAENYYVTVNARPLGSTTTAVTTYISDNILPANLTGVTLSATPSSPQVTGTPITLSTTVRGGIVYPNVQYQFYAQYKLANGSWSSNILIQDWSTSSSCVWIPTTAENYYVNVNARPVGDTAPYAVTTYISYNILPANLTGVTLTASPASPLPVNSVITLTAAVQGGITPPNVQYQFVAQYKLANGAWAPNLLMSDWSTSSNCVWNPTTAENYYLNVYARPVGDTAPYAVTTYIVYTIQ